VVNPLAAGDGGTSRDTSSAELSAAGIAASDNQPRQREDHNALAADGATISRQEVIGDLVAAISHGPGEISRYYVFS
jgi:hypothetical protein